MTDKVGFQSITNKYVDSSTLAEYFGVSPSTVRGWVRDSKIPRNSYIKAGKGHSVVAHTRQILHTATTNEHNTVLLQVMALTTNVRRHLKPVGEPHATDLSQSRVRLLRGGGVDACADAATLRASLQCGNTALGDFALARLAHKLVNGCHSAFAPICVFGAEAPKMSAHSIDRPKTGQARYIVTIPLLRPRPRRSLQHAPSLQQSSR